jgi:hypothetical protein
MMRRSVAPGQRILLRVARIVQRDELNRQHARTTRSLGRMKRCGLFVNITRDCGIATELGASPTSRLAFVREVGRIHTAQPAGVPLQDPKRQECR